ncbi:MAG: HlyD family efflux transporter periplasmic adaptor subunit [Lachnospiraceae bacterium]|nr:HlyD family efflux transporter periplasmic adaptor subunit [Lachnospiraceae bacterium]
MKKNKKKIHLSLSLVIFIGILVYILVNIIGFVLKDPVSVYEVKAGKMTDVISTTGIAIRDEKIVKAKRDGYINYYVSDVSKVYKGETVYSLDSNGKIKDYIAETMKEDSEAADKNISNINATISDFKEEYDYSNFEDVYSLKQKLDHSVLNMNGDYIEETLEKIKDKYGEDAYQIINSTDSGVISYTVDNFEKKEAKNIKKSDFQQNNYEKEQLSSNKQVSSGDKVYRIVKDENWEVVLMLSKEEYEELEDMNTVRVTFLQDNITTNASVKVRKDGGQYYGYLSLSKYMIRYINDRFLDIEISLDSNDGYKIPKSAVVEKDFYAVPIEYLTKGGNSTTDRVLAKSGNEKTASIKNYSIYKFEKDKDKYFYLDADEVEKDTVLFANGNKNSAQMYLEKTVKKQGVYCVNQGFAQFCAIEKINSSEDYILVETDTVHGISLYDHIVLNGEDINEDEIIY